MKVLSAFVFMTAAVAAVFFGPSPMSAPFSKAPAAQAAGGGRLCPPGEDAYYYCNDNGGCIIFCA